METPRFKLFRLYIKWSLGLKHVVLGGGGGNVTFGVYRFWRAYIDGYSALCVVYEVSLEVVMTTCA